MDKHPKVRDDVEDLDDEITDEVVPSSPRLERVKKKSFYPWHKPRKQYVRNIWKNNVKSLLRKIKRPEENNVFRYFTLPGADMLDIRHLEEVVRGEGFKLKYLGFDSTGKKGEFSDEFELSLSQNAVRSDTEWVERSSTMIWDSLETLVSDGNKDSVNLVKVKSHAPFDAINIDLCKSIAYSKGNESSVFDALVKLIEVQVHKSSNQWLLFITTKIEKEEVSQRHLSAFLRAVEDNCNTSKMFKDHFEQFVVRREVDSNVFINQPYELAPDIFKDAFSLGFAKWLVCFLYKQGYQVSMKKSQFYSVGGTIPDMLSLVFKCSKARVPIFDNFGLVTPPEHLHDLPDEPQLGLDAVIKVEELENLDELISPGSEMWERMAEQTKKLLEKANYINLHEYDDWVAQ